MSQLAILIGVIMCFVAFGTDTAPEGTHNLGLLQHQMMLLHTGLALTLAGVIRIPRTEARTTGRVQAVDSTVNPGVVDANAAAEAERQRVRGLAIGGAAILALIVVAILLAR